MPSNPKLQEIAGRICSARGLTLGPEVGAGNFKHTFEARTKEGSPRALKVYRRAGADARTTREVEAIKRCAHPGIAQFELIETWSDGQEDYVYSLEEFLSGGTLSQRLTRGLLTYDEVRSLGLSLTDAVGHIAALGLVHRDIKPDNIMFRTAGGQPVIVDFGLVRDLKQVSLTKTWLPQGPGTPLFAAPEQLRNEKALIDWRTDQFALGVVLAMCGTGNHPYALPGISPAQVVDRVMNREAMSLEFERWAKDSGLSPLIRMVAAWPIHRFRTASQLLDALRPAGGSCGCLPSNGQ